MPQPLQSILEMVAFLARYFFDDRNEQWLKPYEEDGRKVQRWDECQILFSLREKSI